MAELAYAEKFGCHPQDVARTVALQWWERWQWYEKAYTARAAVAHSKVAQDWTRDLTENERRLILWTNEEVQGE